MRLAALAAVIATLALPSTSQAASTLAPTRAGLSHWQALVFRPGNLDAWWRGYFAGSPMKMAGCHLDRSLGVPSYSCRAVDVSTVLAIAGLIRTGACTYAYVMREAGGSHQLTRAFRFCG
jgi:hypothetical protein